VSLSLTLTLQTIKFYTYSVANIIVTIITTTLALVSINQLIFICHKHRVDVFDIIRNDTYNDK
jgi:hypothetical protein